MQCHNLKVRNLTSRCFLIPGNLPIERYCWILFIKQVRLQFHCVRDFVCETRSPNKMFRPRNANTLIVF